MSTFKGIISEFPQIRIDYFGQQPQFKPPLACFLSHVHSDHLLGLESMRAPFVYCSAATKNVSICDISLMLSPRPTMLDSNLAINLLTVTQDALEIREVSLSDQFR